MTAKYYYEVKRKGIIGKHDKNKRLLSNDLKELKAVLLQIEKKSSHSQSLNGRSARNGVLE